jgi:hypothetical protein
MGDTLFFLIIQQGAMLMLKCYNSEDNNCTKECKGRVKKCPLAVFLNGDRKTKPNKKVMEKFIAEYKPEPRKTKPLSRVIDQAKIAVAKAGSPKITLEDSKQVDAVVDKIMRIVYGKDYDKVETKD